MEPSYSLLPQHTHMHACNSLVLLSSASYFPLTFLLLAFDIDFSALCLSAQRYSTLPVQEREQGWVEKRISLYSDEFRSPIGIYSIIYRYKIKGKLKLN